MIRLPNPGSDIPTFIHIFQTLFTYLSNYKVFTLDDMSQTLAKMKLAASSGYVGEKALKLSTRKDRSRDPLYNQSKMYAELYRSLGWITSSEEKALLFSFTLLGEHMAAAKIDPKSIFEESVLGINYPNQVIDNKNENASRTFATILLTAYELNGYISRDEIIVGPLNIDDTDLRAFSSMIDYIKAMRSDIIKLQGAIAELSKRIKIQINTMKNYTRFPISVLTYCGWFEKVRKNILYPNGRNMVILKMTQYGREKAEWLKRVLDIRTEHFEKMDEAVKPAMIRLGFYTMLQRANFDVTPVYDSIAKDSVALNKHIDDKELLFSPYQTIKTPIVNSALGIEYPPSSSDKKEYNEYNRIVAETKDIYKTTAAPKGTVRLLRQTSTDKLSLKEESEISKKIKSMINDGKEDQEIVDSLFAEYHNSNQTVFYPLISDLFCILGFNCTVTRAGINYERWDAIAIDDDFTIPIEIKSPSEEEYISIKAVRQALENKIILLSRKTYNTDWNTVSLAVGYHMPRDRADVGRLIDDIKFAFNIKIGIIDFKSLLIMAIKTLRGSAYIAPQEIRKMEGLINVENS